MDDPELDSREHKHALRGLQRINAWTGNAALAWNTIANAARQIQTRPLRLLDIATGSADIPIALMKLSAKEGISLEIDACDISQRALSIAAAQCDASKTSLRLFRHDILANDLPEKYDIVMCSQFLHHLTDAAASAVLHKMMRAATNRVVVLDLERSRLNWLQVWLATRCLSRSRVVHFDGPQSVRAAFTVPELNALAQAAGFSKVEIRRKWPCRFVMVGEIHGNA